MGQHPRSDRRAPGPIRRGQDRGRVPGDRQEDRRTVERHGPDLFEDRFRRGIFLPGLSSQKNLNGAKGLWCLVLHAHLPYIRHPEHDDFLEEDWFFEAVTETYIPILLFSERLVREGVNFRFTINLSPPLCGMM